tara:strand:- start:80 stop:706 length:627 start_codon:yes stop_codon:yes gene_type:complete
MEQYNNQEIQQEDKFVYELFNNEKFTLLKNNCTEFDDILFNKSPNQIEGFKECFKLLKDKLNIEDNCFDIIFDYNFYTLINYFINEINNDYLEYIYEQSINLNKPDILNKYEDIYYEISNYIQVNNNSYISDYELYFKVMYSNWINNYNSNLFLCNNNYQNNIKYKTSFIILLIYDTLVLETALYTYKTFNDGNNLFEKMFNFKLNNV